MTELTHNTDNSTALTVAAMLERGEQLFEAEQLYFGHGTTNAWDEAVAWVYALVSDEQRVDRLGVRRLQELQDGCVGAIVDRVGVGGESVADSADVGAAACVVAEDVPYGDG